MTVPTTDAALVLFSGGQDSTVCLAWALERFARVETIGFDYGQRHAVELAVRPRVRPWRAAGAQTLMHNVGLEAISALGSAPRCPAGPRRIDASLADTEAGMRPFLMAACATVLY